MIESDPGIESFEVFAYLQDPDVNQWIPLFRSRSRNRRRSASSVQHLL
jgi:hypothetical protein